MYLPVSVARGTALLNLVTSVQCRAALHSSAPADILMFSASQAMTARGALPFKPLYAD